MIGGGISLLFYVCDTGMINTSVMLFVFNQSANQLSLYLPVIFIHSCQNWGEKSNTASKVRKKADKAMEKCFHVM